MAGSGREELEKFCGQAYPELVAALTHQFGDRWLAEELAQEALVRACGRWDRVAGLASPVGWTFRVGVNLRRSRLRRRGLSCVPMRGAVRTSRRMRIRRSPVGSRWLRRWRISLSASVRWWCCATSLD